MKSKVAFKPGSSKQGNVCRAPIWYMWLRATTLKIGRNRTAFYV